MKTVRFADNIEEICYYEKENICLQEYMQMWNESKIMYLKNKYIQKNGMIDGFNVNKEIMIEENEEMIIQMCNQLME